MLTAASRTVRTGSANSGVAAWRSSGGRPSNTESAAARTSGLGSASAACAALDRRSVGASGETIERRRPRDRGTRRIDRQCDELWRRTRLTPVRRSKHLAEMLEARFRLRVMQADCCCRPFRGSIDVTLVAGVRDAEIGAQVGSRYPEAVVVPRIDHHVRFRRHVTGLALAARRAGCVHVVGRRFVFRRRVALPANGVTWRAQFSCVRLVAVAAGHARRMHPTRQERTPVVDLVALLAVRMVEAAIRATPVDSDPGTVRRRDSRLKTGHAASGTARRRRAREPWIAAGCGGHCPWRYRWSTPRRDAHRGPRSVLRSRGRGRRDVRAPIPGRGKPRSRR